MELCYRAPRSASRDLPFPARLYILNGSASWKVSIQRCEPSNRKLLHTQQTTYKHQFQKSGGHPCSRPLVLGCQVTPCRFQNYHSNYVQIRRDHMHPPCDSTTSEDNPPQGHCTSITIKTCNGAVHGHRKILQNHASSEQLSGRRFIHLLDFKA